MNNIFIIPSWYPNERSPYSGVFTKEQAAAICALSNEYRAIVSTWGHDRSEFPIKKLSLVYDWLKQYWEGEKNSCVDIEGVPHIYNPVLSWSHRLPFGGVSRLLPVNRKNLRCAQKIFGKIDLIHAHVSFPAGYIARILSLEFGIPYVITEFMGPFPFPAHTNSDGSPRKEICLALEGAYKVIALSPSLCDRIESLCFKRPTEIPFSVNEKNFFTNINKRTNPFIFVTVARISREKGIEVLINSISKWYPNSKDVKFIIAGDGPDLERMQQLARSLKVDSLIEWRGMVNYTDVPSLLREGNAFVLPSLGETFGVAYIEALATGLPIIASKCGGPESIVTEDNGILVEIGDSIGLANAMKFIFENYLKYNSEKIRVDFEHRYSRLSVVNSLSVIYDNAIRQSR